MAPRLRGIKQKKLIIHPSSSIRFLLFYSPKPRSQVRILIYRKWAIHPLKSKLMLVGSTYNLNTKSGDLPNVISIDNNLVSRVPSNKCLGVLPDEKLTFETHIEYICKKACAGIGALRRIKPLSLSAPS